MNKDVEYARDMMQKGMFSIVFAERQENRTEEGAEQLAKKIDGASGVACFADKDGKHYWGVLVRKDAKKDLTKEKQEEENA